MFYDIIIVVQCIFPVTYTIGKHERKTVAWSESAKKRIKAYWAIVKKEKIGDVAPHPTWSPSSSKKNGTAQHRGNSGNGGGSND